MGGKTVGFFAKKKQPEAHLSPMISPKTMNPGTFTMLFAVVPRAGGRRNEPRNGEVFSWSPQWIMKGGNQLRDLRLLGLDGG